MQRPEGNPSDEAKNTGRKKCYHLVHKGQKSILDENLYKISVGLQDSATLP